MAAIIGWWAEIPATIRPATRALTITGGVPVILISQSKMPSPSTRALTTGGGTPGVQVTDFKTATPAAQPLSVSGGVPSTQIDTPVKPSPAMLTVTGGVPIIALSDNKGTSPPSAGLAATGGTPTASVSDNKAATPTTAALVTTGRVPVITLSDNKFVTPTPTALAIAAGVPKVVVAPPPAFGASGGSGYSSTSKAGMTCSITAVAGHYGLVGVAVDRADTITQVKWGTADMTLLTTLTLPGGSSGNAFLSLYGLANVPGGTTTITVSTASSGSSWVSLNAVTYSDALPSSPRPTATGSASPGSQAVTVNAKRTAWLYAAANNATNLGTLTLGGGTQRAVAGNSVIAMGFADSAASVTFTGTASGTTQWGAIAVPL